MTVNAALLQRLEQQYSGGFSFAEPPIPSVRDEIKAPLSVFDGHRFQPRGTCKNRAHDYGLRYEQALSRFNRADPITLVELGILRGVGLAIWCDVFPNARVIGLDIDLRHYDANYQNLVNRGAFKRNTPTVHRFDELSPYAVDELQTILGATQVDVLIDDALHYTGAIVDTYFKLIPVMAARGVYLIEDNRNAAAAINRIVNSEMAEQHDELTVIDFATL